MSNANGPDFVESTRAANDRKPTSATTIYTKKETTASFLQSSLFDFLGGARGEAVELDGFPFSKRVFRLLVQHFHGHLAVVL